MRRIAEVNRTLKQRGEPARMHRAREGYYYFVHEAAGVSEGFYYFNADALPLECWLDMYRAWRDENMPACEGCGATAGEACDPMGTCEVNDKEAMR